MTDLASIAREIAHDIVGCRMHVVEGQHIAGCSAASEHVLAALQAERERAWDKGYKAAIKDVADTAAAIRKAQ